MPSDLDIYRAAHLVLHQYGNDAELDRRSDARARRPRGIAHLVQGMAGGRRDATDTPRPATLTGTRADTRMGCAAA
jgi:hypothetical protein